MYIYIIIYIYIYNDVYDTLVHQNQMPSLLPPLEVAQIYIYI
jgi:hypothetical protein